MANSKYKPLSFNTTMRNPERIAGFLSALIEFEGQTLTNQLIDKIVRKVIGEKLYKPTIIPRVSLYKAIYESEDESFSDNQLTDIIANSPQNHKEAGFDKGWPSRFDTWYKLMKEYGFLWYALGEPIEISRTGHMIIDAYKSNPVDDKKIQNVFLNAMVKYQSKNPFRKTLNDNVPLILLMRVIQRLKQEDEESAGIFRQEVSFFICWKNHDDEELFNYIKQFRARYRFSAYTDELIYNECLGILGMDERDKTYVKMDKVTGETVDEYIRKMKITGVLSLRGNGRFLDFNSLESDKITHILNTYNEYESFDDPKKYYEYMGEVDGKLFDEQTIIIEKVDEIRKNRLYELAKVYSKETVAAELCNLTKKTESKDNILKYIGRPARLEFLTSIALVQHFEDLDVNPNYIVDDEGLPTFTAGGGVADIVCHDRINDEFVEVTLMTSKVDQINHEMLSIQEHQKEARKTNPNTYSVFVAPVVHDRVDTFIRWVKFEDNIDIKAYTIEQFIDVIDQQPSLDAVVMS